MQFFYCTWNYHIWWFFLDLSHPVVVGWAMIPAEVAYASITLLAVGIAIWQLYRSVPNRVISACNQLEQRVISAEAAVSRFKAEHLERVATQEGFEERVVELLEAATSKQRRAAASASRAEKAAAGGQSPQAPTTTDSPPPPGSSEETMLDWARRRAGLN